jgi:hypothetical protein
MGERLKMKISQKKKTELYKAFSEPIMQVRIQVAQMGPGDEKLMKIDEKLFKLEQEIWSEITKTLGIEKP